MQSSLRDQCVVIVVAKDPRGLQRANDRSDSLQLRATLRDALFVDDKGLNEELVRELFKVALVGNLRSKKKQLQTGVGCLDLVI